MFNVPPSCSTGNIKTVAEFVPHPKNNVLHYWVHHSFCLYTDSIFAQIGDSNDKCSSSLHVECWNEDETYAVTAVADLVLTFWRRIFFKF